ncbi:hypothetical protein E2C01_061010 [Portunus trituberculatus]|uniref:Uncharacterized protein n=1 Tax=Portunus trituberculatus TaxID=210409 RepID=A0A5B7HA83_PORTR|nr:hypothetical protein [Portunus trituberculatus]
MTAYGGGFFSLPVYRYKFNFGAPARGFVRVEKKLRLKEKEEVEMRERKGSEWMEERKGEGWGEKMEVTKGELSVKGMSQPTLPAAIFANSGNRINICGLRQRTRPPLPLSGETRRRATAGATFPTSRLAWRTDIRVGRRGLPRVGSLPVPPAIDKGLRHGYMAPYYRFCGRLSQEPSFKSPYHGFESSCLPPPPPEN